MDSVQKLIHIYTGDGKGKTTSAVGIAVRAVGNNKKVMFVQFLKSWKTGEVSVLEKLGVEVVRSDRVFPFTKYMTDEQRQDVIKRHNDFLQKCFFFEGDILILDEIVYAYSLDLVDRKVFADLIKAKRGIVEIVMTGRGADKSLIEIADYVSYIKKVKHPYDKNIPSRVGIEY